MDTTVPILRQDKSQIITNPFIPNVQREKEILQIQRNANSIVEQANKENNTTSIANTSLKDIHKNTILALSGGFNDMFNKPSEVTWIQHLLYIIIKDQRYAYIGIVLIITAIVVYLMKS
jgi:hypothetical protein